MNSKLKSLLALIVLASTSSAQVLAASAPLKSQIYDVATYGFPFVQKLLTGEAFQLKDKNCAIQKILNDSYFQSLTMMGLKIQSVYFSYQVSNGVSVVRITPLYNLNEYQSGRQFEPYVVCALVPSS